VLDASECPPTFNTDPRMVIGLICGGDGALRQAVEGAEDRPELAAADLQGISLGSGDVVMGIATSGRTPYVIGGLAYARSLGAATIGFTCNPDAELDDVSDLVIRPIVGPEVISGSTRMKAGTATKMVLNMLTTGTMIRLGKTYGNLMVDLRATNSKLTDRARRIIKMLTGVDEATAQSLLDRAAGELKTAVVMHKRGVSPEDARGLLRNAGNQLRAALREKEKRR
jgi:N-acetylmuramic acid 6-phosphate etherase